MIAIVPDRDELAQHGISVRGRRLLASDDLAALRACARARRRATRRGRCRWSSTPASTPAARPRTSSSFASPARRSASAWGDVNAEISEEHFDGLRDKVAARLSEGDVYVDRRVRGRRSGASPRGPRDHGEPLARALREDALHRPDGRGARRDGAAGARPARAVRVGRARRGRHAHRRPSSACIPRASRS